MPGQNFDRAAGIYDATRGWPPGVAAQIGAGLYQALAPFAQPGQRLRVIEAGAGTGRVLLPLAEAGAWTTGVDISAGMLGVLREKAAAANRSDAVRVVRGDASRLPFAAASFDAGLVVHVLHLVDAWPPVLAEIERIVRPGGALAFGRDEHDDQGETWLDTQWTARLAEAGWAPQERSRSAITTDAAKLLAAAGYTMREMVLATWTTERTPESYLRTLRDRCFSSTWNVPDAVLQPAVARLTEDILDYYGRLDLALPRHNQFRLILLQRPG
jgi:ubiquinone/menaquinone biosynthesis C-methylase UbiE